MEMCSFSCRSPQLGAFGWVKSGSRVVVGLALDLSCEEWLCCAKKKYKIKSIDNYCILISNYCIVSIFVTFLSAAIM